LSRRRFVGALGALGAAAVLPGCASPRASTGAANITSLRGARVVVVGGGFGGATCARHLKRAAPELDVTVVEPAARFVTCPMSNAVLGGLRDAASITHDYRAFAALGVTHVRDSAAALDLTARQVMLAGGGRLSWDRLVLAPGIEFDYSGIEGADASVADRLPHAWKAGAQTELLAGQLRAMRPGGLFVMAIPDNPYRCPPGPYERASLVADHLRRHNPTAKILLLDAKDAFSKQDLFEEAWAARYPGMIERLSRSDGARLTAIDADRRTFVTEFDTFTADVGNFIPPQRAPALLRAAGLDAGLGWCEVHPATFESRVAADVHIVGDAINANPMPKSAFVANNQAKACAAAVVAGLRGEPPPAVLIANTCYSLVAADYGISITGLYRASGTGWDSVEGSVGTSPTGASGAIRAQEARYAFDWYQTIVADTFG
jgi:NADPH-dependent 2,4-dienoyl-CoA reductase/sulfur reductase-like enzyme